MKRSVAQTIEIIFVISLVILTFTYYAIFNVPREARPIEKIKERFERDSLFYSTIYSQEFVNFVKKEDWISAFSLLKSVLSGKFREVYMEIEEIEPFLIFANQNGTYVVRYVVRVPWGPDPKVFILDKNFNEFFRREEKRDWYIIHLYINYTTVPNILRFTATIPLDNQCIDKFSFFIYSENYTPLRYNVQYSNECGENSTVTWDIETLGSKEFFILYRIRNVTEQPLYEFSEYQENRKITSTGTIVPVIYSIYSSEWRTIYFQTYLDTGINQFYVKKIYFSLSTYPTIDENYSSSWTYNPDIVIGYPEEAFKVQASLSILQQQFSYLQPAREYTYEKKGVLKIGKKYYIINVHAR